MWLKYLHTRRGSGLREFHKLLQTIRNPSELGLVTKCGVAFEGPAGPGVAERHVPAVAACRLMKSQLTTQSVGWACWGAHFEPSFTQACR